MHFFRPESDIDSSILQDLTYHRSQPIAFVGQAQVWKSSWGSTSEEYDRMTSFFLIVVNSWEIEGAIGKI